MSKPGEYYEFQVDMVNDGSIDAMVENVVKTGIDATNEKYVNFNVTYENGKTIKTYDKLAANTRKTIKVRVEYKDISNEEDLPKNEIQLDLGVQIKFTQADENAKEDLGKSLVEEMKNLSVTDESVNFSEKLNSSGNFIYQLTQVQTSKPIYYYRGSAAQNHVLFGGFCWRVIRTTETGGVKLIYNGLPRSSGSICMNHYDDTAISSGSYNGTSNPDAVKWDFESSYAPINAKKTLDTWFEENLIEYQSFLEDTPFYNESNYVAGSGGVTRAFAPRVRLWGTDWITNTMLENIKIKLGAENPEDIFTVSSEIGNGKLKYPIGLITSDEVLMAGNVGYLYTGREYWTMSPAEFRSGSATTVWMITVNGSMNINALNHATLGYRPVISLKPNTTFVNGDGTVGNPYNIA